MKFLFRMTFLFLVAVCTATAETLDVNAVSKSLLESGGSVTSGESPETGFWIVVIGSADATGKTEKDAL
ncbi:MAG: hypothetical protein RSB14_07160, partial [Kiritimatiellia bacterium]